MAGLVGSARLVGFRSLAPSCHPRIHRPEVPPSQLAACNPCSFLSFLTLPTN